MNIMINKQHVFYDVKRNLKKTRKTLLKFMIIVIIPVNTVDLLKVFVIKDKKIPKEIHVLIHNGSNYG